MIRNCATQEIQPEKRHLGEHAPLIGNACSQNVVERGDAVGRHDQQTGVIFIDIAHFAAGSELKPGHIYPEHGTALVHTRWETNSIILGIRMMADLLRQSVYSRSLAEGHLTRRVFGAILRRIWALPLPVG